MVDFLKKIDPDLIAINSVDGQIYLSNKLQGRIFAGFGSFLAHRLVKELAENPDPVEFNNLGGNSLWPAPEGGNFAYNYPPGGDWYVQQGINSMKTATVEADENHAVISKEIELLNRKGNTVKFLFKRTVRPLTADEMPAVPAGVERAGYHSVDELIPLGEYSINDALIAPWSLEQFPGAEGITAFGRCKEKAEGCVNDDFYGNPAPRLRYNGKYFFFELGGENRLQIGIKVANQPEMIGAIDRERGMFCVRTTPARNDGKYINIADNDQASGPFGAADMFSIFNGSQELNFYELETIAPMSCDDKGIIQASRLESVSIFCRGDVAALESILDEEYGVKF